MYWQDNWVEKIMFKNELELIMPILKYHSEGEMRTPTELEMIMYDEVKDIIRRKYDNKEGNENLITLIKKTQKSDEGKKLLEITGFDKKIKLNMMPRTWEFTRPSSMIIKNMEVFFYVIISNTQNIIYFCMMLSMYQNSGFISIIYPFSIFGYALLEQTRPR